MTEMRDGTVALDPRLGRVPSFDDRSWAYPVRGLLAAELGIAKPPLRSWTWPMTWLALDQGSEGSCVGHGHGGRVKGAPDLHPEVDHRWCRQLYLDAQRVDEWAGEDYEGTSVLAGAKVLTSHGLYDAYYWAFGVEDTLRAIGYLGPVVVGTAWLDGMFEPRPSGLLEVTGSVAGGHCYLLRGVRLKATLPGEGLKPIEVVRIRNSWGPEWGVNGDAYLRVTDLEQLLAADGEACVPTEPRQHRTEV